MSEHAEMSRTRIADAVEQAFVGHSPTPTELAAAARSNRDPEVAQLMDELGAQRYVRLADLWSELPGVPIDA